AQRFRVIERCSKSVAAAVGVENLDGWTVPAARLHHVVLETAERDGDRSENRLLRCVLQLNGNRQNARTRIDGHLSDDRREHGAQISQGTVRNWSRSCMNARRIDLVARAAAIRPVQMEDAVTAGC